MLRSKDVTKGALYDDDDVSLEQSDRGRDVIEVAEVLGMAEENVTAHEAGVRGEQIEMALGDVDGEECEVVVFDA